MVVVADYLDLFGRNIFYKKDFFSNFQFLLCRGMDLLTWYIKKKKKKKPPPTKARIVYISLVYFTRYSTYRSGGVRERGEEGRKESCMAE